MLSFSFFTQRLARLALLSGLLSMGALLFAGLAQAGGLPFRSALVGETCFATPDNGATVYSSTTAQAVRDAVGAAPGGGSVKFAGYCPGAVVQGGSAQVVLITKTLTLAGGYTLTDWNTAYPLTQPTTLDAQGGGRVISTTAVAITLQGFTLTNGYISTTLDANGGGLYAAAAANLSNMIVAGNVITGASGVQNGGGVYIGGAATLVNTMFKNNQAQTNGGGAFLASSTQMSGTTFNGNLAATNNGGGAFFQGLAVLTNSLFTTNTTEFNGGGAYFINTAFVSGTTFSANRVLDGNGGGATFGNLSYITNTLFSTNTALNNGGGAQFNSTTTLSRTTFSANVAFNGGGACFFGAAIVNRATFNRNVGTSGGGAYFAFNAARRFINTLFAGNSATAQGAAIYVVAAAPLELLHTTVASPTVANNQAIYVSNGTVYLTNTLVASHTIGVQNASGVVQENYNFFSGVTTPYTGPIVSGANSLSNTAAFFNTTAYTLTANSIAVDRGTNVGVTTDFFGDPRPQGTGYDIGYDESPYSLVYSLIPVANPGGTVTPSTPQAVSPGSNHTFTITPNVGYHIVNVTVNGVSLGPITNYTFTNITANHILTAVFAINTYLITPTTNPGGSITPGTVQTVDFGSTLVFTVTPDVGHYLVNVGVDGVLQGPINTYTFTNIAANHTITALFAIYTYVITPSAGVGGSILPNTPQTVNHGTALTFTITPNTGYTVVAVLVDGIQQGALTSYAFTGITTSHTISAFFTENQYALVVSRLGNGTGVITSTPVGINCGTSCSANFAYNTVVTLTATPTVGSFFVGWGGACSGTGVCVSTIADALSVSATFTTRKLYLPFVTK